MSLLFETRAVSRRLLGNMPLSTKDIAWRTTNLNLPWLLGRSTIQDGECCWRALRCRITCPSCGHCWTFCCLRFSIQQRRLINGTFFMFVCLFALCSSRAIQFTYYLLKFCTGSISPSHHSERPAQLKMVMTPQTNCSLTKSVCLSSIVCTNFCVPSCSVGSRAKFSISYQRR